VAALATVFHEGIEGSVEHPRPHPGLIAAVAGLVGRVPVGQIVPRGTGFEDPEDPVEHIARVAPRPAASIGTPTRLGEYRLEHGPLVIDEVHESAPGPRAPGV